MARLLVSIRSAAEACAAVSGGADIIDVKEPAAGPLGCANPSVWGEVRRELPAAIPMSVALGEQVDWSSHAGRLLSSDQWRGISFAKMGLAGSGPDWLAHWRRTRSQFEENLGAGCRWVAVIYADWISADSPNPDQILTAAIDDDRCAGVLVDTWGKNSRFAFDLEGEWRSRMEQVQRSGRFFAWAGGLDITEIERFIASGLKPDIIAVRGSACRDGDRLGMIDPDRVARLRNAAAHV